MTSAQNAAFQAASGIEPASLALLFASLTISAILLWAAWLTRSTFVAWTHRRMSFHEFIQRVLRAAIVVMLLVLFIHP